VGIGLFPQRVAACWVAQPPRPRRRQHGSMAGRSAANATAFIGSVDAWQNRNKNSLNQKARAAEFCETPCSRGQRSHAISNLVAKYECAAFSALRPAFRVKACRKERAGAADTPPPGSGCCSKCGPEAPSIPRLSAASPASSCCSLVQCVGQRAACRQPSDESSTFFLAGRL